MSDDKMIIINDTKTLCNAHRIARLGLTPLPRQNYRFRCVFSMFHDIHIWFWGFDFRIHAEETCERTCGLNYHLHTINGITLDSECHSLISISLQSTPPHKICSSFLFLSHFLGLVSVVSTFVVAIASQLISEGMCNISPCWMWIIVYPHRW